MQRELEQQSSHHASDLSDEVPALRREERTGVSDVSKVLGVTFPAGIDDSEWVRSEKEELDSLAALSFRLNPEAVTPDNETPQKNKEAGLECREEGEEVKELANELKEKSMSELNDKSVNESTEEQSSDKSKENSLNGKAMNEKASNEKASNESSNDSLNDKAFNDKASNDSRDVPFPSTRGSNHPESEVSATAHSGDPPSPSPPSPIHSNQREVDSLADPGANPPSAGMHESPPHSSPISSLHATEAVPPSASQ